jgi:hypothetical protein
MHFSFSEAFETLPGVQGLAEPLALRKRPLSGGSAHGLICCRLTRVVTDPLRKCCAGTSVAWHHSIGMLGLSIDLIGLARRMCECPERAE